MSYSVIENVMEDPNVMNQITSARSFVQSSHVPEDLRQNGRVPGAPIMDPNRLYADQGKYLTEREQKVSYPPFALEPFHSYEDNLSCKEVFKHLDNCPLCSVYYKKDFKFYWLIIFILVLIIFCLINRK